MASATYAEKRTLTLGEVIDGYLHLSEADKSVFRVACMGGNIANAVSTDNSVVGASKVAPEGHTIDPKTGKVFKLVPKKNKTGERIRLETSLTNVKKEWSALVRELNITLDVNGRPDPPIEDPAQNKRAGSIAKAMGEAKNALSSYKEEHPEEFLPPPNKGKGKTGKPSKTTTEAKPQSSVFPQIPSPKGKEAEKSAKESTGNSGSPSKGWGEASGNGVTSPRW